MKKILLYGFSGFDIFDINPSEILIETLKKENYINTKVIFKIFKVDYHHIRQELNLLWNKNFFDAAIGFGFFPNIVGLRIEELSLNIVDIDYKDINGLTIKEGIIIANAPIAYKTGVDTQKIKGKLLQSNIPCYISYNPDTYICNFTYYLVSHYISSLYKNKKMPSLFCHIPLTIELSCKYKAKYPSLPLNLMKNGALELLQHVIDII